MMEDTNFREMMVFLILFYWDVLHQRIGPR